MYRGRKQRWCAGFAHPSDPRARASRRAICVRHLPPQLNVTLLDLINTHTDVEIQKVRPAVHTLKIPTEDVSRGPREAGADSEGI